MLFMFPCRISWSFVLFCFVLHTVPNTLSISSRGPSVTEQHHYSSSLLSVEPFQMKIMSVAVLGESSGQYEIRGLPKFFFFFSVCIHSLSLAVALPQKKHVEVLTSPMDSVLYPSAFLFIPCPCRVRQSQRRGTCCKCFDRYPWGNIIFPMVT